MITARRAVRTALNDVDFARSARVLPARVAALQIRSRLRARRSGDLFSLTSATRPADLARLLALAAGRRYVVELGTGSAWTTIALAVADPTRQVLSFDPVLRPERDQYLSLLDASTRARIELVTAPGASAATASTPVEMLYVDSSHTREDTLAELEAWTPRLADGALVVLDDYTNPQYPGIAEAVAELGLPGEVVGTLFVHRHER